MGYQSSGVGNIYSLQLYICFIQTTDKYNEKTDRYGVETFIVSNRFVPTLGEKIKSNSVALKHRSWIGW